MVDRTVSRKDHGTPVTWEYVRNLVPIWPWHEWLGALSSCTESPDGGPTFCDEFHTSVVKVRLLSLATIYLCIRFLFHTFAHISLCARYVYRYTHTYTDMFCANLVIAKPRQFGAVVMQQCVYMCARMCVLLVIISVLWGRWERRVASH
jgi:hypothetical protein